MTYPQMDPRRLDLTGSFGLRVAGRDAAEVRIGTAGRWGQRVNLATNPSFETTTGSYVTVRTNLATSPKSYTPAASGPHPGLGAGPYTGSAEIDGVRQEVDPLALVGGTTYVRLLIESGTVPLGDYFDGDESPDPDLTPAWTGAVNGSPSTLSGQGVGAVSSGNSAGSLRISSTRWGVNGARSLRIIPVTTDSHATPWPIGYTGSPNAFGPLVPGSTYRVIAVARLEAALTGALSSYRLALRALYNEAPSAPTLARTLAIAPNEAGEHRLSGILTVPPAAEYAHIRLYNGASAGNGDVWWDNLLIEDVTDLAAQWAALPDPKPTLSAWLDERLGTDHFDGDTPNTPAALHHWTGTPHASTSVQTLAWTPGD